MLRLLRIAVCEFDSNEIEQIGPVLRAEKFSLLCKCHEKLNAFVSMPGNCILVFDVMLLTGFVVRYSYAEWQNMNCVLV